VLQKIIIDIKKIQKLMLHSKPLEILREKKNSEKSVQQECEGNVGLFYLYAKVFQPLTFLNVFVVSMKVLLFTSVLVCDTATVTGLRGRINFKWLLFGSTMQVAVAL
jgi:hypothetical protein